MKDDLIRFHNISKTFKKGILSEEFYALKSLNFSVKEEAVTGFLGANGAGKTTSLKILMNLISQDSGEIQFGKGLGKTQKEIFSNIGYLPERPYFYPHLTGRQFATYLGRISDVEKGLIGERLNSWATRFKLDHALDRLINGYSKGMLQRLGFICALLHDPKLLILDEPLSGLDPVGRAEIKEIILELKKSGKSVFFSSHIVSDVEEVCSEAIIIEQGELAYEGKIEDLLEKHSHGEFVFETSSGKRFEVMKENKDQKLNELVEKGESITKIFQKRPTLEQIIYHVGENRE